MKKFSGSRKMYVFALRLRKFVCQFMNPDS